MLKKTTVCVPGTTANCGPGFDAVGMACTIYNKLELTLNTDNKVKIDVEGEGSELIPRNDQNIVYQAIQSVFQQAGYQHSGLYIRMMNEIPLARGLGSSAAAIVAGLTAANSILENAFSQQEIFELATEFEGHPDNVAPAIFGGVTLSAIQNGKPQVLRFIPPGSLDMVVAIPEFSLATKVARQVLPQTIPFNDAVFNISRTALLVGSLCKGDFQHLSCALEDRIHQPYRQTLIPGMQEVFESAVQNGAYGATISGAGPCLMAFTQENAIMIGKAMVAAFAKNNINAKFLVLNIDTVGAKVLTKQ